MSLKILCSYEAGGVIHHQGPGRLRYGIVKEAGGRYYYSDGGSQNRFWREGSAVSGRF
jgi:hypothetical protein